MRLRGLAIAGLALIVVAVTAVVVWPSIAETARRRVADRLRDETGQDWRVEGVGLTFSPMPQIVLRNLAFGDDREGSEIAGARILELRLGNPVSMMLGSGSNGHAVAQGVSIRTPLTGKSGTAGTATSTPSNGKAVSVEITARGANAGLAESGRAAFASAETMEVDFDLASAKATSEIRATLELPRTSATASLSWPVARQDKGDFTFALDPRDAKAVRVAASGKASVRPTGFSLDTQAGTIDAAPFKGSVSIDWDQAKPRISLDAQLDALTLIDATSATKLESGQQAGLVVPVTPDTIPDVRWFSGIDATGKVSIARLTLGPTRFDTVTLTGTVKNNGLDAAFTAASGYGGSARGRYVLSPEAESVGRHQFAVSLSKMQVLPLLSDAFGVRGIDGSGTLRVDLQATGTEVDAVRRSLKGSANLSVTDGKIDGLDLAGAIGLLPSKNGRNGALATRLGRLAGNFSISEGQAISNDLAVKTSLIEATGIGSIDLIARTLDVRLKPQVVASGARQQGNRNPLDVPVHIVGPWANPAVSADFSGIAENPEGAMQSLQDLGSSIIGEKGTKDIGDALGGLLDGLLGKSDRGSPLRPRSRSLDDDPDSAR
ncbi:AsmA family protein [Methylobacterium sp. C25]|uniref:AsmA family protein n=1 Tax=Methylobacterium sp. C25 TaxID=2721622 RepID=UPI001F19F383|nr:AsmA-like C-terminal region-containing protein [Methylobacterium sp. C25]MCE4222742.1 AsmA family protein [Methylobacterium sp. C25]